MELLAWIDDRPRTYGETMGAWRTSCPRVPIWEDATDGAFVEVVHGDGAPFHQASVRLTASGRAMLTAARGTERRT